MWTSSPNSINYLHKRKHEDKFLILFKRDINKITRFFNVDRATAYRWINAGKPTNKVALRLLDVAACGFLPCSDEWDGFSIVHGRLITPLGYDVLPIEITKHSETLAKKATSLSVKNKGRNARPWVDKRPLFIKDFLSELIL